MGRLWEEVAGDKQICDYKEETMKTQRKGKHVRRRRSLFAFFATATIEMSSRVSEHFHCNLVAVSVNLRYCKLSSPYRCTWHDQQDACDYQRLVYIIFASVSGAFMSANTVLTNSLSSVGIFESSFTPQNLSPQKYSDASALVRLPERITEICLCGS